MKFRAILLLVLFTILYTELLAKKSSHRARKHRRIEKINEKNIYLKFTQGVIEQMGGDPKDIESCLPADWKSESSTDGKASITAFEHCGGALAKIAPFLSVGIDSACKFKNDVKDFSKKKLGVRRYRRVFVQLQKVNNKRNPFDDIVTHFGDMHEKVKEMLDSPLAKKAIEVANCLKDSKTASVGFINTVKGFKKRHTKLNSGLPGFIDIMVDVNCRWRRFKESINFLSDGTKNNDNEKKYRNFGRFLGKFIKIAGN